MADSNNLITILVIVIVLLVILCWLTPRRTIDKFKSMITKTEYMDEISFDETKEGNMNKLVNEELSKFPKEMVGVKADLDIDWKNKATNGYKSVSYLDGERGGEATLDDQDSYETQLAESIDYAGKTNNDKFVASDDGNGNYADYTEKKKDYSVKELMDSEQLLPQEENNDWFDTVPEPVKVSNRHLININRPIGIDTVGSSMKIPCLDLRGNIPAPKHVVSPFLNSSVEPDIASVGFCNKSPYQ